MASEACAICQSGPVTAKRSCALHRRSACICTMTLPWHHNNCTRSRAPHVVIDVYIYRAHVLAGNASVAALQQLSLSTGNSLRQERLTYHMYEPVSEIPMVDKVGLSMVQSERDCTRELQSLQRAWSQQIMYTVRPQNIP
jgi:hypothetical protein